MSYTLFAHAKYLSTFGLAAVICLKLVSKTKVAIPSHLVRKIYLSPATLAVLLRCIVSGL